MASTLVAMASNLEASPQKNRFGKAWMGIVVRFQEAAGMGLRDPGDPSYWFQRKKKLTDLIMLGLSPMSLPLEGFCGYIQWN